jgi:hypothetical protein
VLSASALTLSSPESSLPSPPPSSSSIASNNHDVYDNRIITDILHQPINDVRSERKKPINKRKNVGDRCTLSLSEMKKEGEEDGEGSIDDSKVNKDKEVKPLSSKVTMNIRTGGMYFSVKKDPAIISQ